MFYSSQGALATLDPIDLDKLVNELIDHLPNLWLWEMIDEFIYQFQSHCQYRGRVVGKTKDELAQLNLCDANGTWSAATVLNFLHQMVEKSEIVSHLDKERATALKFSETEGYEYAASNVLRTLGYFSLIGISRVKILTGDYEGTAGRGFPKSEHDTFTAPGRSHYS